ncbi:MAG TPA: hypothetical protein VJ550_00735, partial [Geomonas sp.]|nr:hypothetical protein [Geomonas sp.]
GVLYKTVSRGYYFDSAYRRLVVRPLDYLSEAVLARRVEPVISGVTLAATSESVQVGSRLFSRLQSGNLQAYLLYAVAGLVVILWVGVFHA